MVTNTPTELPCQWTTDQKKQIGTKCQKLCLVFETPAPNPSYTKCCAKKNFGSWLESNLGLPSWDYSDVTTRPGRSLVVHERLSGLYWVWIWKYQNNETVFKEKSEHSIFNHNKIQFIIKK